MNMLMFCKSVFFRIFRSTNIECLIDLTLMRRPDSRIECAKSDGRPFSRKYSLVNTEKVIWFSMWWNGQEQTFSTNIPHLSSKNVCSGYKHLEKLYYRQECVSSKKLETEEIKRRIDELHA